MNRDFELRSDEGLPITGTLEFPHDPVALVVIVHGFKGFRQWGFFPWLSEQLVAADIAVCRFDMSRNGIDGNDDFTRLDLFADDTYSIQLADLTTVLEHLSRDARLKKLPLFLFGHSRGGGVVLLASREVKRLRGVITWSAISELRRWDAATIVKWREDGGIEVPNQRTGQIMRVSTRILDDLDDHPERLDIMGAVRSLSCPLLVVHGGADDTVPSFEAEKIGAAAPDAALAVLSSAGHTFGAIHPLVHVPAELRLAASLTARFVHLYVRRKPELRQAPATAR